MYLSIRERLRLVDKGILLPFLFLISFSILAVYSASSFVAMVDYDSPSHYLLRQSVFVLMSLGVFFFMFMFPLRHLQRQRWIMYATFVLLGLLVLVLAIGEEIYGAKRWISLSFFNMQPAEFAKLLVIWYLAYIFSLRSEELEQNLRQVMVRAGTIVAVLSVLIFVQPDTGTVFVIGATFLMMAAASGVRLKYSFGLVALSVGLFLSIFLIVRYFGDFLEPLLGYRYERFLGFSNPFQYAEDAGHQLINSYYALSRGGIWGVGLGNSVQKTGYLPFPYTDFILPVIGEELGLVGLLVVLSALLTLITRIFLVGTRTTRNFDSMLCIGIASMLLVQSLVNGFGVTGMLPITGITFPFLSYGGSSLLVISASVGLAANASVRERYDRPDRTRRQQTEGSPRKKTARKRVV